MSQQKWHQPGVTEQQYTGSDDTGWLCKYNVYNFNQILFILPNLTHFVQIYPLKTMMSVTLLLTEQQLTRLDRVDQIQRVDVID